MPDRQVPSARLHRPPYLVLSAAVVVVLGSLAGCGLDETPAPHSAPAAQVSADQTSPGSTPPRARPVSGASGPQSPAANGGRARPAKRPQAGSSAGPSLPPGSYDDTSGTTARPPTSQKQVLASLPGERSSACVTVGDRSDVRSGLLAMGNFADARKTFHETKGAYDAAPSFFYVIPQDPDSHRVVVTLTPLTGQGEPLRVISRQVEQAAQWRYFPITVKIPSPGTWRFTVDAGAQRGCFEATFRA